MAPVEVSRSENDNHVRAKGSKGCLGYFMLFSEKPHRNTAVNSEQSGNRRIEGGAFINIDFE